MADGPLRIGVSPGGFDRDHMDAVRDAERLGVDTVWVPEAWMFDALTPLGYLAGVTSEMRLGSACVQLGARTPAMLAMSSLALQELSGGRFVLGVGTSGPQVMEGWHGVRFDRPVTRTAETIAIIRQITAGERLEYSGEIYELPLPGGQGKALRSPVAGVEVPIFVASMGPRNLRLTGAMADGWIGTAFMPESADVYVEEISAGAVGAGRRISDIELTVAATLEFTNDVEEAGRRHAGGYAFTIGAMGSPSTNFYNQAFTRQGFGEAVEQVHALWQNGDREAAAAAVPVEIGLHTNLLGDDRAVADRLRRYRSAGITSLRLNIPADGTSDWLDTIGRLMDLVGQVNAETTG